MRFSTRSRQRISSTRLPSHLAYPRIARYGMRSVWLGLRPVDTGKPSSCAVSESPRRIAVPLRPVTSGCYLSCSPWAMRWTRRMLKTSKGKLMPSATGLPTYPVFRCISWGSMTAWTDVGKQAVRDFLPMPWCRNTSIKQTITSTPSSPTESNFGSCGMPPDW